MPQTLVLGSQGEDVKLLQRTLNQSSPTALPLLWVDGDLQNGNFSHSPVLTYADHD